MHAVVVGAGPAGLMAAEVAATAGHQVSVYEQRRSPARKFVLAGRGGLNLTHSEPIESFMARYGPEADRLAPAIEAFDADDLRAWCAGLGHETFIGTSGRVFPESFRAVPLLRAWLGRLDSLGVRFHLGHRWLGWDDDGPLRFQSSTETVSVDHDVAFLALGGASWPRVGGDGSWQQILSDRGVASEHLQATNCGVKVEWSDVMVERFAGQPVKNAAVVVDGEAVRGDPIVTRSGLEGGPVYAHSRAIRERLASSESALTVDLLPDIEESALVERLGQRRRPKQSAARWLERCGVASVGIALMREATANRLPPEPERLAALVKGVPIDVRSMAGIDRAISSAGGVAWAELDERFQFHQLPNVYAIGEMLDWEAPTGGYLLQACFSTARWAAHSAI